MAKKKSASANSGSAGSKRTTTNPPTRLDGGALAPKQPDTVEHQLVESKPWLQALMQALPVGVTFSADLGCRHVTGNPAALAQFEVQAPDNLSASASDVAAPGRQVRYFRDGRQISDAELPLQRAVAENRVIPSIELEVELPSGRHWITEASGAPVHDAQGCVIGGLAVTVDITDRKRAEEALRKLTKILEQRVKDRTAGLRNTIARLRQEIAARTKAEQALTESEKDFRTLAEQSPNMIFINHRGRVVYANPECEKVMGYSCDEFYAPDFDYRCLIAPEFRDRIESQYQQHMRGEEVEPIEYAVVAKDGTRIEAFMTTRLIEYEGEKAILGVVVDITKIRSTEESLRQSEARYRLVADNVADMVWVARIEGLAELLGATDSAYAAADAGGLLAQFQFTFISPSIQRVLGYEVNEGMRLKSKDMLTAASYSVLQYVLAEEVTIERSGAADPARLRTLELEHVMKDGGHRWCEVTVTFLRGESGQVTGVVGSTRDISSRKNLEREISAAIVREQQQIGQELHDGLGQELLGLGLMAKNLQKTLEAKGLPEAGFASELVQMATNAHDHVHTIIKGVRPVEVEAGGLMVALGDLARTTQRLAGQRVTFDCRGPISVEDNLTATQLFYIAQEAVRNAVKHAGAKHITIGLAADDHHQLQLWIRDNGRGIPSESKGAGGMGFHIMRRRATAIGGILALEPVKGGGTLVTCSLPLE